MKNDHGHRGRDRGGNNNKMDDEGICTDGKEKKA